MVKTWLKICLLALSLAAVAAGCGGGEGTAASSLTKAEFIKAADAICEEADKTQDAELKAYLKDNPKAEASKAGQIKLVASAGLPSVQSEIEELTELGTPEGEEAEVEALFESMEKALAESESDPSKVLTKAGNPFVALEKQAADYGFKACNSPL